MVRIGQALARLDSKALEASLRKAEAQIRQTEKRLDSVRAEQEQQRSQMRPRKDFASKELLDQRKAPSDRALAAFNAAQARIREAEHVFESARQEADVMRINSADHVLIAPKGERRSRSALGSAHLIKIKTSLLRRVSHGGQP